MQKNIKIGIIHAKKIGGAIAKGSHQSALLLDDDDVELPDGSTIIDEVSTFKILDVLAEFIKTV
jgi:hypothetical protein